MKKWAMLLLAIAGLAVGVGGCVDYYQPGYGGYYTTGVRYAYGNPYGYGYPYGNSYYGSPYYGSPYGYGYGGGAVVISSGVDRYGRHYWGGGRRSRVNRSSTTYQRSTTTARAPRATTTRTKPAPRRLPEY